MAARDDRRDRLPAGTVTLLFADLEGSTRLLHGLGDRYEELLTRKRTLVREIATRHDGRQVDWTGDGVFLAFSSASGAVAAAAGIQRALAAEKWPADVGVRLRIGVHTGEPKLTSEGYVGIDVHRAARICAAAHGGQVVLSQSTRALVGDEPFPGASLRPLGAQVLKDLPEREALFQLVAPGLAEEFPPLRSLSGATLPALYHRLVGRRDELARVEAVLESGTGRLMTITGPGGAGKSRLALEAAGAAAAKRPVYLVGLASIADADLVPSAIARAVGARESPERALVEEVADRLAGSAALVVLDNLEHLAPAASTISRLLDLAPDLTVLATSRSPLRLAAERVLQLEPLPVDDAAVLLAELARARGVTLGPEADPAVREICRRLDGLPLAIELVAARLTVLSPPALLRALGEGLALAAEGPVDLPERQRTLRATIDWSYGLLTANQRELHAALASFAGGARFEDASLVAGTDAGFLGDIEALVAGGLLRSDAATDGEPRLSMLETVREYALDRLAAEGRLDDVRRRHAKRFFALCDEARAGLSGPDQAQWLERLEREHDNLRAALDWAFASGQGQDALEAVSALGRFWRAHSHVREARAWLQLGLELAVPIAPAVRARALWTAARLAMAQSDHAAAAPQLEEALGLFQASGDESDAVFALCELSLAQVGLGEAEHAEALADEALRAARRLDEPRTVSAALNTLGNVYNELERFDAARTLFAESLALRRELGDSLLVANTANNLGFAAMRDGDLQAAEAAFGECLLLARRIGDTVHTASATLALGEIALATGDAARAADLLREAHGMYESLGDERTRAECLYALGGVAAAEGRSRDAARLWGAADGLRERLGVRPTSEERAVERRFSAQVATALDEEELRRASAEGRAGDPAELVTASLGIDRAAE